MRQLTNNPALVARCGLYCGACPRYLKEKCPGCAQNEKASWCGVRKCTTENGYTTCADCTIKPLKDCKEYNDFMAKVFGLVFNSNRSACILRIKEIGAEAFATEMTAQNRPSLPRK